MAQKFRNYCFTLNNYTENDIESLSRITYKYLIIGKEIAPNTGTPHLQGLICFVNARSWNSIKKLYKWHVEPIKGTIEQNITYCKKEKNFIEFGTAPSQGKRTDLDEVKKKIVNSEVTVDQIVIDHPTLYHQYGRTLNKIEDIVMRKKYRTEMTKGIWIYGPTGTGKSHEAFENFTPETHYVLPNDNGWWDGYTQQDTVIINDFRGEIKYNDLLNLVDKWPYYVKRRNREPMPFVSKLVIITSSLKPEDIYKNRCQEDKIEQLLRRFEIIQKIGTGTEVVEGNTDLDPERYLI